MCQDRVRVFRRPISHGTLSIREMCSLVKTTFKKASERGWISMSRTNSRTTACLIVQKKVAKGIEMENWAGEETHPGIWVNTVGVDSRTLARLGMLWRFRRRAWATSRLVLTLAPQSRPSQMKCWSSSRNHHHKTRLRALSSNWPPVSSLKLEVELTWRQSRSHLR